MSSISPKSTFHEVGKAGSNVRHHVGVGVRVIVDVIPLPEGGSRLTLSLPDRGLETVDLENAPNPSAAESEIPSGSWPLAVRIDVDSEDVASCACTCLIKTERGPKRIQLSVAAGLALVAAGRHGIISASSTARSHVSPDASRRTVANPQEGTWI